MFKTGLDALVPYLKNSLYYVNCHGERNHNYPEKLHKYNILDNYLLYKSRYKSKYRSSIDRLRHYE